MGAVQKEDKHQRMEKTFSEAMKNRRSVYALGKNSGIKAAQVVNLVKEATDYVPSAFNSQSQRVVVLQGEAHDKFWSIVMEDLRKIVPADKFAKTEEKIKGFAAGEGTILFFDDEATTSQLIKAFPLYADNFKPWAEQQNGMLQFAIWTKLEEKGFGANLQHYNPLIDEEVKATWKLPKEWKLRAEMVYGKKLADPDKRDHKDITTRVLNFDK
jgi:predicted oxidoreductase (fatty acid repression mutant protein)